MKLQTHSISVTASWLGTTVKILMVAFMLLTVAVAQAQSKVVVIPLLGDEARPPIKYKIGDTGPAGGIVFHVTNEGLNGLEAAPVDQAIGADWGCWNSGYVSVEGVVDIDVDRDIAKDTLDPNSGAVNTPLIAVQCADDTVSAAVYAAVYVWPNGQTDGFLPNKDELRLLYKQKDVLEGLFPEFAGFLDSFYWSSSEKESFEAWSLVFSVDTAEPENELLKDRGNGCCRV